VRKILTALERVSVWHEEPHVLRRMAAQEIHRGIAINPAGLPDDLRGELRQLVTTYGVQPREDLGQRLLDHITTTPHYDPWYGERMGLGRHWSVSPGVAERATGSTWASPRRNPWRVVMRAEVPEDSHRYTDDPEIQRYHREKEWQLDPGDEVNVTGLRVRGPGPRWLSWAEIPVASHVRAV